MFEVFAIKAGLNGSESPPNRTYTKDDQPKWLPVRGERQSPEETLAECEDDDAPG